MPLWRAKRLIIFTIICREDVFVVTRLATSCNSFWKVLSSIYTTLVTRLLQVSKKDSQPLSRLTSDLQSPPTDLWSAWQIIWDQGKGPNLVGRWASKHFFWGGGGWYTWYTLRLEGGVDMFCWDIMRVLTHTDQKCTSCALQCPCMRPCTSNCMRPCTSNSLQSKGPTLI